MDGPGGVDLLARGLRGSGRRQREDAVGDGVGDCMRDAVGGAATARVGGDGGAGVGWVGRAKP